MKPVLFASTKPLERAENLKAVYEAYDGEKAHVKVDPWRKHPAITSGEYGVMVIDEYPTCSPGKAVLIRHGIAGGKRGGLNQPHPYFTKKDAELITFTITSGTGAVGMVASSDGIPESKVLPLGMPRTDMYVGKRKGDGHTGITGNRVYLYAPTYRGKEDPPLPKMDWEWLDKHLSDGETLVVKAHPMTGMLLIGNHYRHIREIGPMEPTAPYLYDCDAVVTDYSSVIFDGYLLGKPAVLFEKNRGYTDTRGMNMRYPEEYCSRYATNEQELLDALRGADGLGETEKACIRRVADMCDGHACERVCGLVKELAEGR